MEEKPVVPIETCEREYSELDTLFSPKIEMFSHCVEHLKTKGFTGREAFYIFRRWTEYRDGRHHLVKATNLFD